jgi:predicted nucleotidyltransferase
LQREEAYKIAQQCAQFLKERFNVDNVYIFGSVVGDGIWHKRSDIDIAVEGLPPEKYFRALSDISELLPLGLDLDLITIENAPTKLRDRIKTISEFDYIRNDEADGDITMSENNIDRLSWQIELELESLEKTVNDIKEPLEYALERGYNTTALRSIGSCLQDFYSGIERIFERIAVLFDGGLPEGLDWHIMLLKQMENKHPKSRPAVIDHSLALELLEYLRFRHLFRHTYGYELRWDKMQPLAIGVSDILNMFKEQIACFLNKIQELKANEA